MTELKTALIRELKIDNTSYKLTVSPQGLKLTLRGKRNGLEIAWRDLVNGDAAMAVALRASLTVPATSSARGTKKKRAAR